MGGGVRGFLIGCFEIAPLAGCISSGICFFYRSRVAVMKYWWASGRVITWKKVLGFDPHLCVLIWFFACIDVLFGFSWPFLLFPFGILPCGLSESFKKLRLRSWVVLFGDCGCSDLHWIPFFHVRNIVFLTFAFSNSGYDVSFFFFSIKQSFFFSCMLTSFPALLF